MTGVQVGDRLTLSLGKPASGGFNVSRHEGLVIFVRGGIEGEEVEARVESLTKNFARAITERVIQSSPHRIESPCNYVHSCGGCDFQHIEIEYQRLIKAEIIREQFLRIAKIDVQVEVQDLGKHFGWRTRQNYASNSAGEVGMRIWRSNEIIPIDKCLIASEGTQPPRRTEPHSEIFLVESSGGDRVSWSGRNEIDQKIVENVGANKFEIAAKSFWQIHPNAPDVFSSAVMNVADLQPGDHVLDLYGGSGLFAVHALGLVGESGRVEVFEHSIDAIESVKANFSAIKVRPGDVAKNLREVKFCNVVILDPPRTGVSPEVIKQLGRIKPRKIAYLSCDPSTLARDAKSLLECGYQLISLEAFDAFPQTSHVETLAGFALA